MARPQTFSLAIITLTSFLSLVVFVSNIESKHYHSFAGPFKIVIRRVERCPDEDLTQQQLNVTYREYRSRYSPTLFSGNATMPFYLNDNLTGSMSLASWDRVAGWKPNAHNFHIKRACSYMNFLLPHLYRSYMSNLYGYVPECNYYPGIYRFQNYSITWDDIPVKQFYYGRWRCDLEALHPNGERAACVRGYGDTVPV